MRPRVFEETVLLPHLDPAFNHARWLTRNEAEAEGSRERLQAVLKLHAPKETLR